jgi:AcrR family transcriptional regulator
MATTEGTTESVPDRLPRGRHKLSREEVESSQQERMRRAMSESVGAVGYNKTTVAEVLRRAGVSRETFYAQYKDKHDCFLVAFDSAVNVVLDELTDSAARARSDGETTDEVLSLLLRSFLEFVASEPDISRMYYVEVYAAGQDAIELRAASQARAVDAMLGAIEVPDEKRFVVQATMASIGAIIQQFVSLGQTEQVVHLHDPLLDFMLAAMRGADITF